MVGQRVCQPSLQAEGVKHGLFTPFHHFVRREEISVLTFLYPK
jgi:hypothetical protein